MMHDYIFTDNDGTSSKQDANKVILLNARVSFSVNIYLQQKYAAAESANLCSNITQHMSMIILLIKFY